MPCGLAKSLSEEGTGPYIVGWAGTSNLLHTSNGIACCSECGSGSVQVGLAGRSQRCCWDVGRGDLHRMTYVRLWSCRKAISREPQQRPATASETRPMLRPVHAALSLRTCIYFKTAYVSKMSVGAYRLTVSAADCKRPRAGSAPLRAINPQTLSRHWMIKGDRSLQAR